MQIVVACVVEFVPTLLLAAPFSFDDVDFWVGSGANRAAFVVDWVNQSTEPPALAWGYRWDGTATGRDMLLAIVAADDRLFAKLGDSSANPVRVFGLGYDADGDGDFGIDDDTAFDESGIAIGSPPFFPAATTDTDDYYAEGWTFDFWHYGVAPSNPFDGGSWSDTSVGMAGRVLTNGSWDSWAFEQVPQHPPFVFTAYAENPVAAAAPSLPGDYNRDHHVNDLDYQLWKSEFGSTNSPAVDGNGNGVVDAADYTIWRNHLVVNAGSAAAAGLGVPEPASISLALCSLCALWLFFDSRRKVKFS